MKYEDLSDEDIIEAIRKGQKQKYAILVNRYSAMIFHIVRKYIQEPDMVEEMAQQIFVKAYENIHSFESKSKFSTWLYALGKNQCLDYVKNIRRKNKNFSELSPAVLRDTLTDTDNPEKDFERQEWSRLLEEALSAISPEYTEAFLMKYQDQMTYKAMSDRLEMTVSALKVRVHRARKELFSYMEKRS